jgi:hypothetical protein
MPRRVGPAQNRCFLIGGSLDPTGAAKVPRTPFFVEIAGKVVAFGGFACL